MPKMCSFPPLPSLRTVFYEIYNERIATKAVVEREVINPFLAAGSWSDHADGSPIGNTQDHECHFLF
jgi:hypothetical protein